MFKKLGLILLLLVSFPVFSQTTAVTAQVTDSDGTNWGNLKWSITFFPNSSQSNPCVYMLSGESLCSHDWKSYLSQNGSGDSNGNISFTTLDNNLISPIGSKWVITIQSNTSAPATQYSPIVITGSTDNLTSFLSSNSIAPRFSALSIGSFGYTDNEVTSPVVVGNTYFNVTNLVTRYWNGSSWVSLVNSSSNNTWTGQQSFSPVNLPFGTPSSIEAAAHYISPTWNGYITPGITFNYQTYGIDIAGSGTEQPYIYSRPGVDRGNSALNSSPAVQWTVHQWLNAAVYNYSQGLSLGDVIMDHPGAGDTAPWYVSAHCNSTLYGVDDEGCKALADHTNEYSGDYKGTLTSKTTNSDHTVSLTDNITANPGTQGDGLFAIDTNNPILSTYCSAFTPSSGLTPASCTIGGTATVSTCWGTLASDVATPVGNPTGVGLVSETFNLNVLGGTCTAGGTVWFSDQFHDQGYITSVGSKTGGVQSVTVLMRQPHRSGSWMMEGGTQGFAVFNAAISGGKKYGVDIIGATATNNVILAVFGPAAQATILPGPINFTKIVAINLSNSGTTVSIAQIGAINPDNGMMLNTPTVTISGASDSAFNTQCTNWVANISNFTATCTIAGLTGTHTSAAANVAFGDTPSGNSDFTIYSGGEILDVQDNSLKVNNQIGQSNSFDLEPNTANWTNGDTIEAIGYPTSIINGATINPNVYNNAGFTTNGILVFANGPGIAAGNGGGYAGYSDWNSLFHGQNQEPWSNYQYYGGINTPPAFSWGSGPYQVGFGLGNSPDWGGFGLRMGTPNGSGATDPNYYYFALSNGCLADGGSLFNSCGLKFFPDLNLWVDNVSTETWEFSTLKQLRSGIFYQVLDQSQLAGGFSFIPTENANSGYVNGHIATFQNTTGGIGDSGIPLVVFSFSWTPTAVTASTCAEQTTTVSGVVTGEAASFINPPSSLAPHLWIGSQRVSAANTIAVEFCADATGGTPPSGTWIVGIL